MPASLTDFSPETRLLPEKLTVTDAMNFTVSYHNSCQILTVEQPISGQLTRVVCAGALQRFGPGANRRPGTRTTDHGTGHKTVFGVDHSLGDDHHTKADRWCR